MAIYLPCYRSSKKGCNLQDIPREIKIIFFGHENIDIPYIGHPFKIYIKQLYEDTGCKLTDLLATMSVKSQQNPYNQYTLKEKVKERKTNVNQ